MKFMSFNIKLGSQMGVAPVAELLRSVGPDVVALQEVGSNWREGPPGDTAARLALKTRLDHALFVPTLRSGSGIRYGHALLSRWPIRERERVLLPTRRDEPRTVAISDIVGPAGRFRVVSTHLSHVEADRRAQGPEFSDLVFRTRPTDADVPMVVAGDLNEPRGEAAPWLWELLESFDEAGRIDPRPTFENPVPDTRIDYLLLHGARWAQAEVLDRPDLSDHRPVVATVEAEADFGTSRPH